MEPPGASVTGASRGIGRAIGGQQQFEDGTSHDVRDLARELGLLP
jgi:NAD(P)-dependent dehydrogenase (short-subunit alcohol dehydrogenase family)